jgi:hypothetical protein
MNPELKDAFKTSLRRPAFLAVLVVLFAGAVGINAATSAMRLHFRKEALPLRAKEGLSALPLQIGDWVCVPEPHTLNPDVAHDLGTDQYVFRTYVDTSAKAPGAVTTVATKADVLAMEQMTERERWEALHQIRQKNPNAVLSLAITYYTGKVDTVPHVPDRCYVADGFQPSKYDVMRWDLGEYAPGVPRRVPVRFIDFEDQTAREQQNRCVTYFFHANGEYNDSPLEVRQKLQSLVERYGYFAKIEVMTLLPPRNTVAAAEREARHEQDREAAAGAVRRFLTAALPAVEGLLPDWNARPK